MKRTIQLVMDESEELTALKTLTRVFCSAVHHAFNHLVEGTNPKELIKRINSKFYLNKRYAEDAVLQAQSMISSQKALVPLRIEEVQSKISKTEEKLEAYQTGKKRPKKAPLALCLAGLEARLTKLRKKKKNFLNIKKMGRFQRSSSEGEKILWLD
ncbi:putative transposase [Bacillus fengqiuensis]|nr:putative transposase [Bacillus fengqiuensis]